MSRIGKKPVPLPQGVEVKLDGDTLRVKGPLGELAVAVPPELELRVEEGRVMVERKSELKFARSIHGTVRQLVYNAVQGVSRGFKRELLVVGAGYRAKTEGKNLVLTLGFSHPVKFTPPEGVKVEVSDERISVSGKDAIKLVVSGIDKQKVGQTASDIRRIKPPDAYKGKGIRYADEIVHLKPGKSVTGAA